MATTSKIIVQLHEMTSLALIDPDLVARELGFISDTNTFRFEENDGTKHNVWMQDSSTPIFDNDILFKGNVTVGAGANGVDYTITIDGGDNDCEIKYDEGLDRLDLSSHLALVNQDTTVQAGNSLSKLTWRTLDADASASEVGEIKFVAEANFDSGSTLAYMSLSVVAGEGIRINSARDVTVNTRLDVINAIVVGSDAPEGTISLTINQAGNDDIILSLKSSDIAHGTTTIAEADTYGAFEKVSATLGGLEIIGISESELVSGITIHGIHAGGEGTNAPVVINASGTTGTSTTAILNGEPILDVQNDGANVFLVSADSGFSFGDVTAVSDVTFSFPTSGNTGEMLWLQVSDYFRFNDDVLMNSTEAIYFGDTGTFINQATDGHLDLDADISIDLNANTEISGTVLLTKGAQNYLLTDRGDSLALQGQEAAASVALEIYANDGDTTDFVRLSLFGQGTPGDITNLERMIVGWNVTNSNYEVSTAQAGSGTLRPLVLYTGANTDQFKLYIDGLVGFGTHVAGAGETFSGTITINDEGGTPRKLAVFS